MYGALGVPLFFIISGFVVLMTAWDRDVPSFVASRVGRLFPAYWVAVALSAIMVFWLWPENPAFFGWEISKAQGALNLTMLQSAFNGPNLDGPYWTLWYEAKFYLLIAVFMIVGINRRRVLTFAVLWPIAGAVASASGQGFLSSLLMPDYAPFFAGGMLLYLIFRDGHDAGTWLLVGFQAVLGVNFAVPHYLNLGEVTPGVPSKTLIAAIIIACFVAVAAVTLTPLTRLNARWMTLLGALTYPLYLIHENLGWYVIHLLRHTVDPWVAVAAAAAVALTVAALIQRLVEKPFGPRVRAATLRMIERTGRSESAGRGGRLDSMRRPPGVGNLGSSAHSPASLTVLSPSIPDGAQPSSAEEIPTQRRNAVEIDATPIGQSSAAV